MEKILNSKFKDIDEIKQYFKDYYEIKRKEKNYEII